MSSLNHWHRKTEGQTLNCDIYLLVACFSFIFFQETGKNIPWNIIILVFLFGKGASKVENILVNLNSTFLLCVRDPCWQIVHLPHNAWSYLSSISLKKDITHKLNNSSGEGKKIWKNSSSGLSIVMLRDRTLVMTLRQGKVFNEFRCMRRRGLIVNSAFGFN